MRKLIYLDHAATTPVDPQVLEAMLPFFSQDFGNPSSIYSLAKDSRIAIEKARETIAGLLGAADPSEIIFTSGGTESDNFFIKGVAFANQNKGKHIVASAIEHHAVLHTCEYLEKRFGFEVTYLPVDKYGVVDLESLKRSLREETILVRIMMANNVVRTIQPIEEIGKILRERKIYFHTDAVQAVGSLPINVQSLGLDGLSLSAHKFYGPKGTGALYIKKGVKFHPQQQGGAQEKNLRAGTENVPGIIGMAKAMEIAYQNLEERNDKIRKLRDDLIEGILSSIPDTHLTGHLSNRLPNNASFCFEFVEGESILLRLDMEGIAASSGSACTSASLEPSHVLRAMGIPVEVSHGSLRLTLGKENTEEEINFLLQILPGIIERLRAMSPLGKKK